MNRLKIIIGIVLFLSPFLGIAQNWNAVGLTINSARGNNNCHNTDKRYNFSFSVTLPTAGAGETYKLIGETGVADQSNRGSIYQDNNGTTRRKLKTFGNASSGNFQVKYDDSWNANVITLVLSAVVDYKKVDGSVTVTGQRRVSGTFTFTLNNLNTPAHLNVNGSNQTRLDFYATNSCGVYTLTAPSQNASYTWSLPNNAWFYNSSSTGNSIQIRPTWHVSGSGTIFLGNITLTANKYCDGLTQRSKTFPVYLHLPSIQSHSSKLCYNGSGSSFSIPSVSSSNTVTWHVDHSRVNILSGQYTNSVTIRPNNYYSQYADVLAAITNNCGQYALVSTTIWMGRPTNIWGLSHVSTFGCTMGEINANFTGGANQYEWTISGGSIVIPNVNSNTYTGGSTVFVDPVDGPHGFTVRVRAQNGCGYSPLYEKHIPTNCSIGGGGGSGGGTGVTILRKSSLSNVALCYPNPANQQVSIDLTNFSDDAEDFQCQIQLFHLDGRLVQSKITKNLLEQLDVAELQNGIYFLQLSSGDQNITEKLIVQH